MLIWFEPSAFGCNRRRWSILALDNHFKLCFMLQDAAGFLESIYSERETFVVIEEGWKEKAYRLGFHLLHSSLKSIFLKVPFYETELKHT